MKFLLTSGGVTNPAIATALEDLLAKPKNEAVLAFVPTAANIEEGDKDWLINDLYNLNKEGYKYVDIVDISALSVDQWRPRLENADVLFFGGGNTYHLLHWLKQSGLAALLPELLQTRIYAGISAGSMVAGKSIAHPIQELFYDERVKHEDAEGLGFADFLFIPHLNAPFFPKVNVGTLRALAKEISQMLYALDDQSALKIVDGEIEVVGDGECLVLND